MGGLTLDDLFRTVTAFSNADPALRASIVGVIAFVGALWIGLIVWTARDVSARTISTVGRIAAVVAVFVLHLFGFFLYLLFRPTQTIAEREEIALEHDLLRQASQPEEPAREERSCDTCGTVIADTYLYCPECRTRIRRGCTGCKALLELSWKHCPYCGKVAGRTKRA